MVTSGYQPVVCGEKYSFNVMYTSPLGAQEDAKPISFHYSINSKSDILVFGHVKYKPRKDALLDYAEFRNVLGANNPKSKSDQSSSPTDQFVVHRFPLSVKITASMAPVSSLLLYYVRPDNEVVSSSHSIEIGQCFDNPVKITWHESRQRPGSMAQFHFEAAPMSLCGISAVDKSTRFLVPPSSGGPAAEPHLLEPDSVFNRLKRFHLPAETLPLQSSWAHCAPNSQSAEESSAEEEQEEIDHLPKPVATAAREKRHSVTYNFAANYVDAIQAFDDFGTVVMSDLILESRPCPPWRLSPGRSSMGPMSQEDIDEPDRMLKAVKAMPLAFQFNAPGNVLAESTAATQDTGYQVDPMSAELQTSTIVRSYFPETWIWELIPTGNQGRATIERKLPDTITEWIGKAVCISSKQGLGIGVPSQITAFQPFFLDYSLPYSIKRGEQLHLKVQLFNYMHHPLPVAIRLLKHDGLDLAPSGNQSSVAKFCVPSKDSVVNEFLLLPRDLGELNISVSAEVDSSAFHDCGPKDIPYTRDDIVKPVLVKAEGFPIEVSQSAFLCPKDFSDDSSVVWDLELPKSGEHVVEGSVRAHVSLIGDVLGPALDNLDQLVRLPMGCGEQNMILFVPNIHAIAYLDAISRHEASEIRAKALNNMRKGYQRELNYRHPDGSYSAFGPTDEGSSGSMWLTAFVVKSFAQARGMIQIDERDLKSSWIVRRQLENGCFPVVGQVFHKDMKGGLREEGSSALTAYVLISLLESGVPLSTSNTLVNNALYCLEKASASEDFATDDNPYSAVLTTYALALLEHPRANESLRLLMNRASRQNNLVWWEDKSRPSLSLSVEMTAYGVLSLLKLGGEANLMEALRAVRWLCSGKRNAAGGFTSTQDTILGLEALTKFALAMANASTTELSVLVTATDLEQLYKIDEDNRSVLKRIDLPTVPTSLEIFAEGEGCLLVQSSLRYNKAKATGSEAFELTASSESVPTVGHLESNQPQDRCSLQRLNVCARYKLADEESNMALLEIGMVTGFTPERSSLHDLLDEHATGVKRFEENQDTVVIYFDKLTSQKTCISLQAVRENVVDNAEPGNIKLYDYYQQELTVSTSYRFVDPCVKKNDSEKPGHETNEPMPRKMHLDDDGDEEFNNQLSAGEIPRHVDDQALGKVTREKKIDPTVQVIQRPGSTAPSPTTTDLGEGSGAEGGREEQLFSAKPILASFDVVDEGFSPVFVNVDHELDTPNGIEGPVPVYVPGPFFTINNNTSEIVSGATTTAATSQPIWTVSTPRIANGTAVSCPRCEDGLPADVEDLFCSSTSVVKVAVRRSRKVRLLLDLSPRKVANAGRLRATMELQMKPECTCAPLDKPGIMALIFGAGEARDYSKATDRARVLLDEDSAMFALTDVVGEPREIERARRACSLFAATRGGP
ncbi:murinoglobulin-2-like [Copidosoma floridanum]|uniref:murinoglobulin-2-like n=1 Tax=Copidosoma floridanum TaxID=29053 RepID=UPI000C6FB95A|nr:murinoglobulin-2-like [Copidosoma floridanum]